jgi:hypothetical protein
LAFLPVSNAVIQNLGQTRISLTLKPQLIVNKEWLTLRSRVLTLKLYTAVKDFGHE